MSTTVHLIHLSDLHFRLNWEEDQGVVLAAFFKDLKQQLRKLDNGDVYLVFSGDLVKAGSDVGQYGAFLKEFDHELISAGLPRNRRISIPGNHDVSQDYIKSNHVLHEGLLVQKLNENAFNDFCASNSTFFAGKFEHYLTHSKKFADYGISADCIGGAGFRIGDNIGIYCLNTALCSSAGISSDFQALAIDSRSLYRWVQSNADSVRILVMHHPREWLTDWANKEMVKLLGAHFSLCLHGHTHEQLLYHSMNHELSLTTCSAPPLLTDKHGELGYAIISVSSHGVEEIRYRQWTKHHTFVSGTSYSNSDDGIVHIGKLAKVASVTAEVDSEDIEAHLTSNLKQALAAYQGQPNSWIEPLLSNLPISDSRSSSKEHYVDFNQVLHSKESTEILAPPQFGLTCLAHALALEAWKKGLGFWLYLDCDNTKPNSVLKDIEHAASGVGLSNNDSTCFILDVWDHTNKDHGRILARLQESFPKARIFLMRTIDETVYPKSKTTTSGPQQYARIFLHPLTKNRLRQLVSRYVQIKGSGEEDSVLNRVVNEIEALNIHRTPENCLTILKVAEIDWDESPINRTEMIRRVLYLLFNTDEIPGYKEKPDLKDCEYVLGCFCEDMLRNRTLHFKKDDFISKLKTYCRERVLSLEVDVVFDVLHTNNIIVLRSSGYAFKALYWVTYFAAHRMYHDADFARYVLENKNYMQFPEVVEFYTGIDRSRKDALLVLLHDLRETCDLVNSKGGLPIGMNPYRFAQWNPSHEAIEQMHNEVSSGVLGSKFPDIVKDEFSDQTYNPSQPFNHDLTGLLHQFSVDKLRQGLKASSRALRNSDYVDPDVKRELLKEITRAWEQLALVIIAIAPLLARHGRASFDGHGFELVGDFGESVKDKLTRIWNVIPLNIVSWCKADITSKKLGSLFHENITAETNELRKHSLVRLMIAERPRNWRATVEEYIVGVGKNSFYLADCVNALRSEYQFGYLTPKELSDVKHLIKMGLAKHNHGTKRPGITAIRKISDDVLPDRNEE